MKKVAVILGSDSDWPVVKAACAQLEELEIPWEAHILSAHRTPDAAARFAKGARDNGFGAVICAAGLAALLSTVQMPSGIPVAAVALNGAKNAALLAAEILAVCDDTLAGRLDALRRDMEAQIAKKEDKLQEEIRG